MPIINEMLRRFEQVLFFLIVLFLPAQLGKHFWPQFSYVYSLKIDYLSPTLYFWDLLVLSLFVLFLLNKGKINKLAFNIFSFFMLTQVVSLFSSLNLGGGFVRLEQYFISGLFGLYIASVGKIKDKILLPLACSLIFISLLSIAQVIKGGSLGFWILGERAFSITTPAIAKFDFYGIELLRPYATLPHPNVLAAFLLIATLLILINRELNKKFLWVGALAMLALLLTFSRIAILAGLISFWVILKKQMKVVLIIFLIISPLLFVRYASLFNHDSLTVLRRAELSQKALTYFSQNPLTGIGINNFIPVLSYDVISGPNRFLQPVHSIYLLSLSETGLIGFMGLIVFLLTPIFKSYKQFLIIWAAILFLGLFDHYFLTLPQGYRLLFLLWGVSLTDNK